MKTCNRIRQAALVAGLFVLAGCGGGGGPTGVSVTRCNVVAVGSGVRMDARFTNTGDKPVAHATVAAEFYRNFTYSKAHGVATFSPILDPGQKRDAAFPLQGPPIGDAPVMRCTIESVVYGDGTTAAGS